MSNDGISLMVTSVMGGSLPGNARLLVWVVLAEWRLIPPLDEVTGPLPPEAASTEVPEQSKHYEHHDDDPEQAGQSILLENGCIERSQCRSQRPPAPGDSSLATSPRLADLRRDLCHAYAVRSPPAGSLPTVSRRAARVGTASRSDRGVRPRA
jgi:hypothetical protein